MVSKKEGGCDTLPNFQKFYLKNGPIFRLKKHYRPDLKFYRNICLQTKIIIVYLIKSMTNTCSPYLIKSMTNKQRDICNAQLTAYGNGRN